MGVSWIQSEGGEAQGLEQREVGGAERSNSHTPPLLRSESGPRNTKGLGGVEGSLPIRARHRRTGGRISELKTRTAEG